MSVLSPDMDPLGQAVKAFANNRQCATLYVYSDIAEDDIIPVEYLFSGPEDWPEIERKAMNHCKGSILDVGAAAGRHSLALQEKGMNVTALDFSGLCCKIMKSRSIRRVITNDYFSLKNLRFDTLLMLMNGIGIAGSLSGLEMFFKKARELLNPEGIILFDSSDIKHIYEEEDGSRIINLNSNYYGELNYRMQYKNITGPEFPWLFIDAHTLQSHAYRFGFELQVLAHGNHNDYLGMLKKTSGPQ
jgi:SAM-dependent methyltransferase